MYITKGKSLNINEVRGALEKLAKEYKVRSDYPSDLSSAARDIVNLNEALLTAPNGVYAICEKEPRGNLDTGGHHYSVFYTKDNTPKRFWTFGYMKLWGCRKNTSNTYLPHWTFFSTAIGMSRLLDATDGLFCFIRDLGGCYCQIKTL